MLLSHFSHKHVLTVYFLHWCEHKISEIVSYFPEMAPNWQSGVHLTSLYNAISVSTKSVFSRLPCLSTILGPVRAGSVSLVAGPQVENIGGGAVHAPLYKELLASATNSDRLQDLS